MKKQTRQTKTVHQGIWLDVGCGENLKPGWIGLDIRDLNGVDFVHDIEKFPWPLPDSSCFMIMMSHLWEHINPTYSFKVMDEIWRIIRSDGQLQIVCPYGVSSGYIQDPTHCNPSNENTWEYFDPVFPLYQIYKPRPWTIVHYEHQIDGNQLVIFEPRKEEEKISSKINIVSQRKKKDIKVDLTPVDIANAYHIVQYNQRTSDNVPEILPKWKGRSIDKCPEDLWRYQEIIYQVKPNIIVELGTANGASALFFKDMMHSADNDGYVISVDIDDGTLVNNLMRTNSGKRPKDSHIEYIIGSSVDPEIAKSIVSNVLTKRRKKVMVVLDSNHIADHVFLELELYSPLVTKGSYLIVEDSNINGHPVYPEYGPGPYEALLRWLPKHPEFKSDKEIEKRFLFTQNPNGWLKRESSNG
jgi:cephalosporin hydroxylase